MIAVKNIFDDLGDPSAGERISALWQQSAIRIERIASYAHSSPAGFWYDQDEDEWVIVLRGHAAVEFFGGELVELKTGDYLIIPRHVKHRVARTGAQTVWLAVHVK